MVEIRQLISVLLRVVNIGAEYYYCCFSIFVITLIIVKREKHYNRYPLAILLSYMYFVLASTVLSRLPKDEVRINLRLFWTYFELIRTPRGSNGLGSELLLNIAMLIPVGILLPMAINRKLCFTLIIGVMFSVVIELLQLVTHRGLCELDDILNNTIGILLGYEIYKKLIWGKNR